MTVALVRHGRTAWNLARRMQGRADIPLDAHGRAQAESAAELLSRAEWARIVSSPLDRAAETASLIRRKLAHAEVMTDERLIERDYGAAEGMAVSEARERWPDSDYPDAEPLHETTERARRVLTHIEQLEGDSIVVAHGTLLRVGVEALTAGTCPRILNGQVVLLERDGAERFVARFLS
ncbi:histidine phosphatase family protein [Microbacterium sp.]|uniref:histidine phosphatase family protein n=1 Tax=Microbacterium sp. TaxID=51671 RepID=UPI0027324117|nr:histidine phosphatase family protein [Microbacterium sp.]MDP3951792.1 histidine phosphatase family protein [Microbacterium sp.]